MAILAIVILMSLVAIATSNELLDYILYTIQSSSGSNASGGGSGGGPSGGSGGNGFTPVNTGDGDGYGDENKNNDKNNDKNNHNKEFIYYDPVDDARRADRQAMKKALRMKKRQEMFQ